MTDSSLPPEGHVSVPPSKKNLLLLTGVAGIIGFLIVFGAVLPAEYNQDPLGIGRVTGLSRLWMPKQVNIGASVGEEAAAHRYPASFRSDAFEIPLAASGDPQRRNALEFKVRMKKGEAVVFSWAAAGLAAPDDLMFDFHGHTVARPEGKAPVSVVDYEKASGAGANGAITAPLEGIHGWYFRNRSDKPITVRLKLAGYYELIPPGKEGNLASIAPISGP